MNKREEILRKANEIVNGNREQDYGTPENNFNNIADAWGWYLNTELSANDVAIMMCLMKLARIKGNTFKADSYIDAIGYLACGYEIASNETTPMSEVHEFTCTAPMSEEEFARIIKGDNLTFSEIKVDKK